MTIPNTRSLDPGAYYYIHNILEATSRIHICFHQLVKAHANVVEFLAGSTIIYTKYVLPPPKANMSTETPPWMNMYFLLKKSLLGQWLNFKLFGITYLVGKITFKLLFFRVHWLSEKGGFSSQSFVSFPGRTNLVVHLVSPNSWPT